MTINTNFYGWLLNHLLYPSLSAEITW